MKVATSLRGRLTADFFRVSAVHLAGFPLTLIVSVLLARVLGPESYGRFTFVLSLLALFQLPVTAGIPKLLTREVAAYFQTQRWSLLRGVIIAAVAWIALLSAVSVAAYWLLRGLIGGDDPAHSWSLLGLVFVLVPIQGLNVARNGVIRGLGHSTLAILPGQVVHPIVFSTGVAILLFTGYLTLQRVLFMHVFAGLLVLLVGTVVQAAVSPRQLRHVALQFDPGPWRRALIPFVIIDLIGVLTSQAGILALGFLGSDELVAALRVADRGAYLVSLPLFLVNMVIAPLIVRFHAQGDGHRLQQLVRQSARGAFVFSAAAGLALVTLGRPIIGITFGIEYIDSAYLPMVILVGAQLCSVAAGSVGLLLAMTGHEGKALAGQIAGLASTVVLAVILIPYYGAVGAAVASGGGILVVNVLLRGLVIRHLGFRPGLL